MNRLKLDIYITGFRLSGQDIESLDVRPKFLSSTASGIVDAQCWEVRCRGKKTFV